MLGTLLGMATTLRGTGFALESAADLHAIRASLAAPVKGLGFAFGTSVAGVATSAMLGLLAALSRRARVQAVQQLDAAIATGLRGYSLAHQREESFRLLQRQAEAMPALVDRLQTMMQALERHHEGLAGRLAASQEAFHAKAEASYSGLAASVAQSLQASIAAGARATGDAVRPAVEQTLAGLEREATALRGAVSQAVTQQLEGLSSQFEATTGTVAGIWNDALARHERAGEKLAGDNRRALADTVAAFERHASSLIGQVGASHAELRAELATQDAQRLESWNTALRSICDALRQEWAQAGEQAVERQREICDVLARTAGEISAETKTHAAGTIAEIGRLVDAASEAPRAAADVVAEVRLKLSESMARDNAMLEERGQLLQTLGTLLDAVNHAATEQRTTVDALVAASAEVLERVGARFTEQVETETGKLAGIAAQVTGSTAGLADLSTAFGAAVQGFGESSASLAERLQGIETALEKSMTRSDEQLAYYVAQAREVVDLSILSQKQIIEDLQRLADPRAAGAESA
jgi:hypothetical protein